MLFGKKAITQEDVLKVLGTVQEPELHRDLVSLGMVEDVKIEGSMVSFTVVLTTPACPLKSRIEQEAREAVMRLPGVQEVKVKLSSRVRSAHREKAMIPGVRNVIAVGSGKGGVGKSTVSVGLALALAESGARVGLLDADIWGPNIPQMMGVQTPPHQNGDKILPALSHGVRMISMGFFVDESTPVIWRGPMVGKMVEQLLTDVEWGELDYLVVDLPPGTGDASLTLAQAIPLSGLVVVVTPQQVAVADALKALSMFRQLNVPILGIVEGGGRPQDGRGERCAAAGRAAAGSQGSSRGRRGRAGPRRGSPLPRLPVAAGDRGEAGRQDQRTQREGQFGGAEPGARGAAELAAGSFLWHTGCSY
ncbi:MAG: P-loop NTPase [Chloroflexota bacterium]